ncbi:hypothetical protein MAR_019632 [Mya arenaria]|uniref:Uncharacterized protein n=1 Tax=Mya arenaria TaxID=6604 RepID=A0ABY7E2N5_MYAAR|nr:hypothetical protein MAR_019632 [Mya arenaria]
MNKTVAGTLNILTLLLLNMIGILRSINAAYVSSMLVWGSGYPQTRQANGQTGQYKAGQTYRKSSGTHCNVQHLDGTNLILNMQLGEYVTVQLGEYVTVQLGEYVTMQLCEYVTVQPWCVCDSAAGEYVTLQLCEYVTVQLGEYVTVQLCEYVTVQLGEYVTVQLGEYVDSAA